MWDGIPAPVKQVLHLSQTNIRAMKKNEQGNLILQPFT